MERTVSVVTSHHGMYIFTWTSTGAKTTDNPTRIIIYFLFQLNRIVFMRVESQFVLSSRLGQCLTSLSKRSHKLDIKIISSKPELRGMQSSTDMFFLVL